MSIEKTIYDKRNLERLNGNVIKLPVHDEWWKIKEKLEEELNGDDESKKIKKEIKVASYEPEIDNPIMALEFWHERWLAHPLRHKFKTLKDFISYSMSEEDQPFSEGGLVSLLRLNR